MPDQSADHPVERLPRRLGAITTAAVLVGLVIGSGIFRVPSLVAREVGSVGGAALVWLLGAGVSLCGALTLAELSATYPRPGGAYVFLREAYGPLTAFLFGWIKLLVAGPSALAAVSLIFAAYAGTFLSLGPGQQRLVAVGLIVLLTAVNIRSVAWSAALQNVSTLGKVVGLLALAGLLFAFGSPGAGSLAQPIVWSPSSWSGFWVALIAVLWTYTGWVDVTYLAGEVKNPTRTFPRAMAGGLGLVVLVYLLANAAYFYVLPMPEMARSDVVAAAATERVFGPTGGALVAALVMLSTLGTLNGAILSNPRIFFSMAEDRVFFRSIAAVHPRYRTPHMALLLFMGLGIVAATTHTFEQLAQIFVMGIWPFFALAVAAVFVIRRKRPEAAPAYRTWGYPVVPIAFLLVSAAMLLNGLIQRPAQMAVSLGVLFLGIPAFYGWRAAEARRMRGDPSAR